MNTGSLSRGHSGGRSVDHPLPSSAEVKERLELYIYPFWAFVTYYMVNFTFTCFKSHLKVAGARRVIYSM
jgi:hypothetical protein